MIIDLSSGWKVTQDVSDLGEKLHLWDGKMIMDRCAHLFSDWESIDRLAALQVLFSDHPYYGRDLRYFNQAPWWYAIDFEFNGNPDDAAELVFSSDDYYSKVWRNGTYLGDHEKYFDPFSFDVTGLLREKNHIAVRVHAPWDSQVLEGAESMRCYSVIREMVKGTYEHADGFIQRDVNPIGIMGPVTIHSGRSIIANGFNAVSSLSDDGKGTFTISGRTIQGSEPVKVRWTLTDDMGIPAASGETVPENGSFSVSSEIDNPAIWSIPERGKPTLYTIRAELVDGKGNVLDAASKRIGFRSIKLERDKTRTEFYLNGERIFMRGTSYFADVYMSEMFRDRYLRDLRLIKEAGFNAVRVHVHVEKEDFYSVCDELGLLVIQDSDFNWEHPVSEEWFAHGAKVFSAMIDFLKSHPSIICWIALNEPDVWKIFNGLAGTEDMKISDEALLLSGRLLDVLREKDPDRPYIKASREEDDPESGDTHTYTGSLATGTEYTAIANTKEKLNTEFGMDIPGAPESLYRDKRVFRRIMPAWENIDEIHEYQYKLIKYYIEHYRMQKYSPCAGYFQFMFIDLCPQSFYGIYDYYGYPKRGLEAVLESGMPVAVMARKTDDGFGIYIANDLLRKLSGKVVCSVMQNGISIYSASFDASCAPDSLTQIGKAVFKADGSYDIKLRFIGEDGEVISENSYRKAFEEMHHIKGHSQELDNELGMRLFYEED